nr:ABC transporter ATP-binding protein [Clostridia bacterium]
ILILDEATAEVDTLSEKRLRQAIKKVTAGRTSVIIAHRLSTVTDADEILVISGGKLAERGSHEKLLAENGIYAELLKIQNADDLTDAALRAAGGDCK